MSRHISNVGSPLPRTVVLAGEVAITSSGAISSQTPSNISGAVVAKTGSESGRYSVTFLDGWHRCLHGGATMFGPDDNAFPTTTGSSPKARLLAKTGFSVQFVREDTQADADPASGTKFTWFAVVSDC
jgi:hypothetical protein